MWENIKRFGKRYPWVIGIAGSIIILFFAVTVGGVDSYSALNGFVFILIGLGIHYAIKNNK